MASHRIYTRSPLPLFTRYQIVDMRDTTEGHALCDKGTTAKSGKGFTLIELMVVIALFLSIGAFGLVLSMDTYRAGAFHSERDTVIAALQKARSQAISGVCLGPQCQSGKPHGVHFENGQYTIFQGSTYIPNELTNEVIDARDGNIKTSGATDIVFALLSAKTDAVTLVFDDGLSHQSSISVGSEGQITWTN